MGNLSFEIHGDGTLGKTLSGHRLAVPANQRSYAWDKTNATELFDDLANAIKADEEYFLGSLVITRTGASGRPEVVDGQQRLATCLILIAAIRDYLLDIDDDEFAGDIEKLYVMSRAYPSREVQPQLILNHYDHEYFLNRVLFRPGTAERSTPANRASHRRIHSIAQVAASRVRQIVAGAKGSEVTERLNNWIEFIRERARVIVVIVPDDANAYIMFETLNDRGVELSKVDLLKNYLFGRSGPDRLRETESRWHSMTGAIESVGKEDAVTVYVRHLWASMHGPTRERELFAVIKAKVKSKAAVVQLAGQLADNANIYAALLNPASSFWSSYPGSARHHMETLILLRMEQVRPLLLALVSHAKAPQIPLCLKLLVACSARFLIVGGLGGGLLEKHYSATAQSVRAGTITTAKHLLAAMKEVTPNDTEFREAFARATVSQAHLARYYLRTLEVTAGAIAQPQNVPNDDQEAVTLEHVLPQSPSSEWRLDPEIMQAYHRRIGNLALLQRTPNEYAGNEEFSVKLPVLQASDFKLTKMIAEKFTTWGPPQIDSRQDELADLAVKAWPLKI